MLTSKSPQIAQNPIFRGRIFCPNGHCVASVPAKVLFSCQLCTNCSISCHCTNCRGRNRQENIFGNKLNTGCMANAVQICVFQNNDPIVLRNFSEKKRRTFRFVGGWGEALILILFKISSEPNFMIQLFCFRLVSGWG